MHSLVGLTPAMERRLVAKIDLAIAPMVCVMYLFCFIDRSNIGQTRPPLRPSNNMKTTFR